MNIEEMAHDYAVAMLRTPSSLTGLDDKDIAIAAFNLAEAMQAEAEKRKDKSSNDFEVDWSQAPDWANWALVFENKKFGWFENEPYISSQGVRYDGEAWVGNTKTVYQGDWKDSLRKRPE